MHIKNIKKYLKNNNHNKTSKNFGIKKIFYECVKKQCNSFSISSSIMIAPILLSLTYWCWFLRTSVIILFTFRFWVRTIHPISLSAILACCLIFVCKILSESIIHRGFRKGSMIKVTWTLLIHLAWWETMWSLDSSIFGETLVI